MKLLILAVSTLLLAACAGAPLAPPPEPPLHDEWFVAPSTRTDASDLFALSAPMREYLRDKIAGPMRSLGRQRGLVEALYARGDLRIAYDASTTRNAAQAFDARAGNCLSLVILTAAFAKELGLRVEYNSAYTEETWSRSGDLYFRSGHVNITLGQRLIDSGSREDSAHVTIDFLPASELRGLRMRRIDEQTVVAMYLNNRAAEALVQGALDDAYWWVREALRRHPGFPMATNTLGVIYLRRDKPLQAMQAFNQVLEREPRNTRAMSNLANALTALGRPEEALAVTRRLAQLEPHPAYHFFHLGQAAMQRGDYPGARDWFAREVARADYSSEFHFWLGVASFMLGETHNARKHLGLAKELSVTRDERDLYAAKLAWLNQHRSPQP